MAKKASASASKNAAKKPSTATKKSTSVPKKVAAKPAVKPAVKPKKEVPPKKSAAPPAKTTVKAAPEIKNDPKKQSKNEIIKEIPVVAAKVEKIDDVALEAKPAKVPKLKKSEQAKINADKAALNEEERRWNEFHEKHKADKAQTYDMKATFEAAKPLQHKVLGWGWILTNDNDRLEVLFRDGKRILISNYSR